MTAPTYAAHASPRFNASLHTWLAEIARDARRAVGSDLLAILLGGGYGRGEGGVIERDGVERPYNDLDLTPVVRRPRALIRRALAAVGHDHECRTGLEVDFGTALTPARIRRLPNRLVWHELAQGHVVIDGSPDVLSGHAPASLDHPLDPLEASRLLLNRGAGLLWARLVDDGFQAAPDPDFVRRNVWKSYLALGDALLIAHGRHATPYAGRDGKVEALASEDDTVAALGIVERYATALRFKMRPDEVRELTDPSAAILEAIDAWGQVFLHVERRRGPGAWADLTEYAASRHLREPVEHGLPRWPRNGVRSLKIERRLSVRYPREALYRELPVLLGIAEHGEGPNGERAAARFLDRWRRLA